MRLRELALCGGLALAACRSHDTEAQPELGTKRADPATAPLGNETSSPRPRDLPFSDLSRCRIDHAGPFLDLGSAASAGRHGFSSAAPTDLAIEGFGDHGHTRFGARDAEYDFWLTEAAAGLELRVRAQGGSAATLSATVDQYRLGTLRVRADGFRTLSFPPLESSLGAGRHQLRLHWSGHGSGEAHAFGLIEWLHWATPGSSGTAYRAPRERSLVSDAAFGGAPRQALVLESPSSVSCPVQLTGQSELHLGLAASSDAAGLLRLLVRRDGKAPEQLLERKVGGPAAAARWEDVTVDLAGFGSDLVQLELAVSSDASGARIAVSEPELVRAAALASVPASARLVVLVIASGLSRELLPPFEGTRKLKHLSRLAEASARFPDYRVPTTLTGGVVASLLSGLSPPPPGSQGSHARLPPQWALLSERIHELSGESAFYTGVPFTRAAFGFDRGWNRYAAFSPVQDIAATAPLERARGWLEQTLGHDASARRLLVVHLRGAHPPWDLSHDEVAELEPHDYAGALEARRGGIILASLRSNPKPALRRLTPADSVRLHALEIAALAKQDDALGGLIEFLERAGLWDRTLLAFTGDVAAGDAPDLPFGEAHPLTEDRLLVPLWIKFPHAAFAGSTVAGLVTTRDVTTTLSAALGLHPWGGAEGVDLYQLAAGAGPPAGRPLVALLGPEYATRWGAWLLRGVSPRTPNLCDLAVDPACSNDILERSPLAAEALWRATFEAQHRAQSVTSTERHELPPLDKESAAAVEV
ncbi:MAG TPA: sulfatase-like hydrolase/transferase, partial [Polyangiaceae bacterium]|nr:sulfatase-like hydrolase/transferase [Polyangiaceae bacterium]